MHGDPILTSAAANCGEAYRWYAEALGRPWRVDEDLILADVGLPVELPPNAATLLRPVSEEEIGSVAERLAAFYDPSPGGGFELWSMWPTPDLSPWGFEPWSVPCMVRDPGGSAPAPPAELRIEEALDDEQVALVNDLLCEGFEIPTGGEPIVSTAFNTERSRMWLGSVDGRPVATSAAVVGDGLCGVYAVATAAEARGRGYGAALSWAATLFRPDLPATLQASEMGRAVYERMGYTTITMCRCWSRERRPA